MKFDRILRLALASCVLMGFQALSSAAWCSSIRIVTFGTSITHSGGWQPDVFAALAACTSKPIKIVNDGHGGATTAWGVQNVEKVIAQKPNIVIMEFAINDARTKGGISLDEETKLTRSIADKLRAWDPGVKLFLMTTNPVFGRAKELRPQLAAYYRHYASLARSLDIGLIDTHENWSDLDESDLPDNLHPTLAAHQRVLVPKVVSALSGLVCRK